MKNSGLSKVCIAALLVVVYGCDPVYSVDYIIENDTNEPFFVYFEDVIGGFDTTYISHGQKIIFLSEMEIGECTEDYMDDLKVIPNFLNIEVVNKEGKKNKEDFLDINVWHKFYPSDSEPGQVIKRVRETDLE